MANTLLDYAVPFSQVASLPPPNFGYLHKIGVVVPMDTPGTPADITLISDPADLSALTAHAEELKGAFDGGMNQIYLIRIELADDLNPLIEGKESEFYTIFAHESAQPLLPAQVIWTGVRATYSTVQAVLDLAATPMTCIFSGVSAYNPLFAFGNLLSAAFWRNQQYIRTADATGTITSTGEMETLFDARVSFFGADDENGNFLGFFGAGGQSITTPYISKEVQETMQFRMVNYLASAQPMNVVVERGRLEQIADKTLVEYMDAGYLDPDMPNDVKIVKTAEAYVVAGNLVTSPAVALWRVKMDAYQTQG